MSQQNQNGGYHDTYLHALWSGTSRIELFDTVPPHFHQLGRLPRKLGLVGRVSPGYFLCGGEVFLENSISVNTAAA